MVIPCIDLMGGKVVQLIQGQKKALEGDEPLVMLEKFAAFPEIQVIDLDQAMGKGSNDSIVRELSAHATVRVGGGVRSVDRAKTLIASGATKVIVGTATFSSSGVNHEFLGELATAIGPQKILPALDSRNGKIVVKGWQEITAFSAENVIREIEPYCEGFMCTYVDKEGMLEGTDLDWFRKLRGATSHEITAAGGITTLDDIHHLKHLNIHAALGMAIYTGKLNLAELAEL